MNEKAQFFNFSSRLLRLQEGDPWHEGLSIIHTPGHNASHHSVVMDFKDRRLVVAGDAIVSKCYYDADTIYPYNRDFMSEEIALKSMEVPHPDPPDPGLYVYSEPGGGKSLPRLLLIKPECFGDNKDHDGDVEYQIAAPCQNIIIKQYQ